MFSQDWDPLSCGSEICLPFHRLYSFISACFLQWATDFISLHFICSWADRLALSKTEVVEGNWNSFLSFWKISYFQTSAKLDIRINSNECVLYLLYIVWNACPQFNFSITLKLLEDVQFDKDFWTWLFCIWHVFILRSHNCLMIDIESLSNFLSADLAMLIWPSSPYCFW